MKKLFTLAAAGTLAALSLNAQAQAPITIDGTLSSTEIAATGYRLVGTYTNPHNFGDYGLLSVYAAADANNVYLFVAGTVQSANGGPNSFQVYLDRPNVAGATAGVALPKPAATSTTSFKLMDAKLEFGADLAVAIKNNGTANRLQIEGVAYTATTATDGVLNGAAAGGLNDVGGTANAQTLATTGNFAALNGAVMAYRNTSDGKLPTNPGTSNSGAAGSYGWEMSFSRANMGLSTNGSQLRMFVLQNNGDGGFLSGDFIPQQTAGSTGAGSNPGGFYSNPSTTVDFASIAGLQVAGIVVGANSVTLPTRSAEQVVVLGVYPNPVVGQATVSYVVAANATHVRVTLLDLMGRQVREVENSVKSTGIQTAILNTTDLTAGTYLVRVQVGNDVATSKVSVL